MKNMVLLSSLMVIIAVGCKKNSAPPATTPTQPQISQQAQVSSAPLPLKPNYGWKQFKDETFETHPLNGRVFHLPHKATKLRVSIDAGYAVFGGVFSDAKVDAVRLNHKILRAADFSNRPCSFQSVDKGESTCELDRGEELSFLIRDSRSEASAMGGLLGLHVRSRKMTERAVLPNKIRVTLSSWQCIENCSKTDSR
jgi:hypothetical protein